MDIRIAVASSDGVWVDQHFGRAHTFQIYVWDGADFELLETRASRPPYTGRGHDNDRLEQAAESIADCFVVIAVQIGPGAVDSLLVRRIRAFRSDDTVENALWHLSEAPWFKSGADGRDARSGKS